METKQSTKHHKESPAFGIKFTKDVRNLKKALSYHLNPFKDRTSELINIITSDIFGDEVGESLKCLEGTGADLESNYITAVITGENPITDPLKNAGFLLFSSHHKKGQTRQQTELALMKYNFNIISKLFLTATTRNIPPEAFFSRENHTDPPSLAFAGEMRHGTKADFLPCLESVTEKAKISELPDDVTAGIADGAFLVHCIVPDVGSNYKEYSEKFTQHGENKLLKVCLINIRCQVSK